MTAIPVLGKWKQNRSLRPTWVTEDTVGRGGRPKWNVCCREHCQVKDPKASEPWEQAEPSSGLRANVDIHKWPTTLSSSGMTRVCWSWCSSWLLLLCHGGTLLHHDDNGLPSGMVIKPQLNAFSSKSCLVMPSLHSNKTVAKTECLQQKALLTQIFYMFCKSVLSSFPHCPSSSQTKLCRMPGEHDSST